VSKIQQVHVRHEERQLNNLQEETNQDSKWQDRIWVMSVAGQAGIYIAFPVILGFAVGLLLDRTFNTVILFSVLLAMAGFGGGVFLVYRWVQTTVKKHLDERKKEE
jgi:F0F1-type ATP synthase assembly protein I